VTDINEDTELTIPLKNLLGMLAVTVIATTAYFSIESRLVGLEYQAKLLLEEVEENDAWIDAFEPPHEVKDTILRVRNLELKLAKIETKMQESEK